MGSIPMEGVVLHRRLSGILLGVDPNAVYSLPDAGKLAATAPGTDRTLWTTDLTDQKGEPLKVLAVTP